MIALMLAAQVSIYVDAGSLRKTCGSTELNEVSRCNDFVTAVNDTIASTIPIDGKPSYCLPKGAPRILLMAAFRAYYDKVPGLEDMPAAAVAIAGFQDSFPCRK